ncbi:MAG: antitoxin [Austwickia sp.]|nr:MAG: antitoxin [Austwickia sp.]
MTDANRHKIGDAIDKAGKFVDSKTDGKFSKQIEQAKDAAGKGVEFVAKQKAAHVPPRPGKPREDAEPTGPAAGWQDTSVQDDVPAADAAAPVGDTAYPNPIPAYTPPQN